MLEVVTSMLMSFGAPSQVPVPELAAEIIRVAKIERLAPEVLAAVVLAESRGVESAYNATTLDHGLMQINEKTARSLGLTRSCLYSWRCNLTNGAKLLAKGRLCQYNVGTGSLSGTRLKNCLKYEERVLYFISGGENE